MYNEIKKFIKLIFRFFGLQINKSHHGYESSGYFRNEQMLQGLLRCKQINIPVNTIVDVGAAAGSWSLSAREIWPDSNYILLEPLHERKSELEAISRQYPNFHFVPAAAGKEKGVLNFFVSDDLDGSGVSNDISIQQNVRKVNVVSIDDEIKRLQLTGPYLIKLDTHGFELPIIEGCKDVLAEVSVFIIECYGFQIAAKSLLFWEMCQHMDQLGFRLFDIVDVMNRAKDGAFWQCDAFFLKKENAVFQHIHYN